jgi:3-dehydrosphinganine reductase
MQTPSLPAVSGSMKPVSAETVAIALARGIEANRFHIVADLFTRLLVRWSGLLEPILRGSFRRTIARSLAAEPPAPPVVTQNAGDSSR